MDLRLKKLEGDADSAGKAPARAHVSRDRGQARDEGLRLLPRSRALDDYWRKGATKRVSGPGSKDVRYPMRARYCREPREERKIWHARLRNVSGDESGPPAGRVKDNPAHFLALVTYPAIWSFPQQIFCCLSCCSKVTFNHIISHEAATFGQIAHSALCPMPLRETVSGDGHRARRLISSDFKMYAR